MFFLFYLLLHLCLVCLCHLDVLALALVRLAIVQLEDDKAQSLGQRKYKLHKYMLYFLFYPIVSFCE